MALKTYTPIRTCLHCKRKFIPTTVTQRVCDVCVMKWIESICPECGHDENEDERHAPECPLRGILE